MSICVMKFGGTSVANISRIKNIVKLIEKKINSNNKFFPKIKNLSKIEEKMNKVKDSELKSSLSNFLKAFDERNK